MVAWRWVPGRAPAAGVRGLGSRNGQHTLLNMDYGLMDLLTMDQARLIADSSQIHSIVRVLEVLLARRVD